MNRTSLTLAGLLATLTLSLGAHATDPAKTPRNEKREVRQEARIEQGKASGALNEKEAARLDAGQARVDTAQDAAKADGVVTKKEKVKIEKAQDRQNRRIAKQKHDKQ